MNAETSFPFAPVGSLTAAKALTRTGLSRSVVDLETPLTVQALVVGGPRPQEALRLAVRQDPKARSQIPALGAPAAS